MLKIDAHTRGIFLTGLLAWCVTFGGSWVAYTNKIAVQDSVQAMMKEDAKETRIILTKLSEKVAENTLKAAVTNSILTKLDGTLNKVNESLGVIVNETKVNAVKIAEIQKHL